MKPPDRLCQGKIASSNQTECARATAHQAACFAVPRYRHIQQRALLCQSKSAQAACLTVPGQKRIKQPD
eukprot:365557-Chlamydomonas_euryale.AAC.5